MHLIDAQGIKTTLNIYIYLYTGDYVPAKKIHKCKNISKYTTLDAKNKNHFNHEV